MTAPEFGPASLNQWVARLSETEIPVLRSTVRALNAFAAEGDEEVNLHSVAQVVSGDPLMTAKLYVHMDRVAGDTHDLAEITAVDRMIMMLGVPPFLAAFESPPQVEDILRGNTRALAGLIHVVQRARRASTIAGKFAVFRNDVGFEELMESAMLHDLAEMLVWCHAPHLALEMQHRLDSDPNLRSKSAQKAVLGVRLNELQLGLVRSWHLPELLTKMMDDDHADNSRVRSVMLAVNIARHSMYGWDNPALPDDYIAAAALLATTSETVIGLVCPEEAVVPEPDAACVISVAPPASSTRRS
jgi:HD-like signal output (HDOD) protein